MAGSFVKFPELTLASDSRLLGLAILGNLLRPHQALYVQWVLSRLWVFACCPHT